MKSPHRFTFLRYFIRVENLAIFFIFIEVFVCFAAFALSQYIYTASGRRTAISAPNPRASSAVGFRHNRIKRTKVHLLLHLRPQFVVRDYIKVENLRFSSSYKCPFYSISVSSLAVPLYGSCSSAENFCSKSDSLVGSCI